MVFVISLVLLGCRGLGPLSIRGYSVCYQFGVTWLQGSGSSVNTRIQCLLLVWCYLVVGVRVLCQYEDIVFVISLVLLGCRGLSPLSIRGYSVCYQFGVTWLQGSESSVNTRIQCLLLVWCYLVVGVWVLCQYEDIVFVISLVSLGCRGLGPLSIRGYGVCYQFGVTWLQGSGSSVNTRIQCLLLVWCYLVVGVWVLCQYEDIVFVISLVLLGCRGLSPLSIRGYSVCYQFGVTWLQGSGSSVNTRIWCLLLVWCYLVVGVWVLCQYEDIVFVISLVLLGCRGLGPLSIRGYSVCYQFGVTWLQGSESSVNTRIWCLLLVWCYLVVGVWVLCQYEDMVFVISLVLLGCRGLGPLSIRGYSVCYQFGVTWLQGSGSSVNTRIWCLLLVWCYLVVGVWVLCQYEDIVFVISLVLLGCRGLDPLSIRGYGVCYQFGVTWLQGSGSSVNTRIQCLLLVWCYLVVGVWVLCQYEDIVFVISLVLLGCRGLGPLSIRGYSVCYQFGVTWLQGSGSSVNTRIWCLLLVWCHLVVGVWVLCQYEDIVFVISLVLLGCRGLGPLSIRGYSVCYQFGVTWLQGSESSVNTRIQCLLLVWCYLVVGVWVLCQYEDMVFVISLVLLGCRGLGPLSIRGYSVCYQFGVTWLQGSGSSVNTRIWCLLLVWCYLVVGVWVLCQYEDMVFVISLVLLGCRGLGPLSIRGYSVCYQFGVTWLQGSGSSVNTRIWCLLLVWCYLVVGVWVLCQYEDMVFVISLVLLGCRGLGPLSI